MAEKKQKERPELVGAMVSKSVREAIETLAERRERSISFIAARVLELDPLTIKEYREVLREARAA